MSWSKWGQPQKRQPLRPEQKGIQNQQRWVARWGSPWPTTNAPCDLSPPPAGGEARSLGPQGGRGRGGGVLDARSPPPPLPKPARPRCLKRSHRARQKGREPFPSAAGYRWAPVTAPTRLPRVAGLPRDDTRPAWGQEGPAARASDTSLGLGSGPGVGAYQPRPGLGTRTLSPPPGTPTPPPAPARGSPDSAPAPRVCGSPNSAPPAPGPPARPCSPRPQERRLRPARPCTPSPAPPARGDADSALPAPAPRGRPCAPSSPLLPPPAGAPTPPAVPRAPRLPGVRGCGALGRQACVARRGRGPASAPRESAGPGPGRGSGDDPLGAGHGGGGGEQSAGGHEGASGGVWESGLTGGPCAWVLSLHSHPPAVPALPSVSQDRGWSGRRRTPGALPGWVIQNRAGMGPIPDSRLPFTSPVGTGEGQPS